jgi:hypothetical protein
VKPLFWVCVSLSLGLHGALAIGWRPHATALNTRMPGGLQGRLGLQGYLVLRPAGVPSTAPLPAVALQTQHHRPSLLAVPGPAAASKLAQVDPPPAVVEPTAVTGAVAVAVDAQAAPGTDTGPDTATAAGVDIETTAGWDHYLARSQLTVVPSPREDILLGYPDDGPAVGRFVLTLTLYIDEAGAVRRVDVASDQASDQPLPDTLREAARAAFASKRFSPGELAGEVVKSRIRIEAVYESLALPSLTANASLAQGATTP